LLGLLLQQTTRQQQVTVLGKVSFLSFTRATTTTAAAGAAAASEELQALDLVSSFFGVTWRDSCEQE
jgi:hypothetical protein